MSLDDINQITILAIGEVALGEMISCQIGMQDLDGLKKNIRASVYWQAFVILAQGGKVPEDWLPGALGRVVLGMAKSENLEMENQI
ncbi:MAG: hypothetical protein JWQ04_658 [Pedosphaera sp.]|nr:hypothetical protein [Pedosphaera sp.]